MICVPSLAVDTASERVDTNRIYKIIRSLNVLTVLGITHFIIKLKMISNIVLLLTSPSGKVISVSHTAVYTTG